MGGNPTLGTGKGKRWDRFPSRFLQFEAPIVGESHMPVLLILLIAVLVWAVWLTPRIALPVMGTLFLLSASVVGYDIWNFQVGVSLSADRLVLLAMVGASGIHVLMRKTQSRGVPVSEWILLAFMALLIANTFLNDWRRNDPDQIPILMHLVEGYVIPCILYWIGSRATLNERVIDTIYLLFGLLGIYLSFTALCEIAGIWSLVLPRKIADPTVGLHFGRARGPFLQSVRLGIYLLASFFMVWTGLVWRQRWGRLGRLLGIFLTPLFLAAILATLTRSVWMGFGIAALTLFCFTLRGRVRRAALVASILGAFLVLMIAKGNLVAFQRETNSKDTAQSTNMRAVFTYVSYLMIKERPISGFGFGHFPHQKEHFLQDRSHRFEPGLDPWLHPSQHIPVSVCRVGSAGISGCLCIAGCLVVPGKAFMERRGCARMDARAGPGDAHAHWRFYSPDDLS